MFSINVTIRDTPKSHFLEDYIFKKTLKLNHYHQPIIKCRVVVDMPQKHKHQGKLFRVSIELNVRGKELVVNRKLDEDVYIAAGQAFNAIERKLEHYAHRQINYVRKRKQAVASNNFIRLNKRHSNDISSKEYDEFYI